MDDVTMCRIHEEGKAAHFRNWLIPNLEGEDIDSLNFIKLAYQERRKIYRLYHGEFKCFRCQREASDVAYIDSNIGPLLTNMVAVCSSCYDTLTLPFVAVCKEFSFEACHRLLDYNGACSKLHGHSYKLQVYVRKPIDPRTDMVLDFSDLKKKVNSHIIGVLDHSCLNDVLKGLNTTAETILVWIWNELEKGALLKGLERLKLWETSNSHAILRNLDLVESSIYIGSYLSDLEQI